MSWLDIAPNASLLASVVRTNGLVKSRYCANGSLVCKSFKVTKASSAL